MEQSSYNPTVEQDAAKARRSSPLRWASTNVLRCPPNTVLVVWRYSWCGLVLPVFALAYLGGFVAARHLTPSFLGASRRLYAGTADAVVRWSGGVTCRWLSPG